MIKSFIVDVWQGLKSNHRRCSVKKVFLKISQNSHLCHSPFFNKVADLKSANLLKRRLWHSCFIVNFASFLRTPILQNTSRWLLVLNTHLYLNIVLKFHVYLPHYRHTGKTGLRTLRGPPRWSSPCHGEEAYPPRSFNQSASTRRAQLSVTAKVVRPTDPLNHNVKTWVNTD